MTYSETPANPADRPRGWLRRVLGACWQHPWSVVGALAVAALATVIDVTFPLLTRAAVDDAGRGRTDAIVGIAVAIAALGAVRFGCQFGRRMLAGKLSLDVQHSLRLDLLGSLQRLDGRGQDEIRTGQVVSRSITDLQLVQSLLAMAPMSVGSALQFVLALVVMFLLSPLLTVVALAITPAIALAAYVSRRSLFAATWSAQQSAADLAQHVEETVTGVRVVKGFGQEARAVGRLEQLGRSLYAKRMRAARINSRFAPTMAALPQVGLVGVVAVGGYLALHGSISIGTFLAFATYVTSMASVARVVSSMVVMAQLSRAAVERVFEVIDTEPEVADLPHPRHLPDGPIGVRIEGLRFGFDPHLPVLDGVDLTVEPGESIALVGPSGSGKTALSLLLPRFYAADAGRIELTAGSVGIDVRDLAAHQLRESVTLVFDEPFLFSDTIAANIALGRPDASAEEIRAAATAAMADEFISALSEGYDTVVGERGLTLSGGQRQRVALARAILGDPRLLILDDATSAVDAATEAQIFAALRSGRAQRTTIAVAHRRSTLSLADRIAVLDGGRVVDIGTEAELEARCELFRTLLATTPDSAPAALVPVPAEPDESALWPPVDGATDGASSARATRIPATAPRIGGGRGGRSGPGAGALAGLSATPELRRAVDALPPATEDPHMDDRALRAENPRFRLAGLLRPVRWLLLAVVVCLALDAAAGLVFPIIVRFAIDHGVVPGHPSALWWAAAAGLAVVVADWLVVATLTVVTARSGERVLYGLRVRSYAHLQRLGLDYYERELSGRIMTRMTTDVDALSSFMQTGMSTAVVSVLTLTGIAAALLATDVLLGAVALAVLPPLIVATVVFRRISSTAYTTSRERISLVNADFQENIAGLRTAQAYRREGFAARRFADRAESYRRARMRAQTAISVFFPFITLLADLVLAAVVLVGAHQVASGHTSQGTLVAFVLYLGLLFGPIQQLSQVFDGYQQARVGLRRIGDLLATPSTLEQSRPEHATAIAGHLRGDVAFDRVGFRYAGADDDALHGIELDIPAGTTVALVGKTGAGKSTVVKLLARFYDPTSGSVRVDEVDVRRYPLHAYRHRLGVVPQEAHLFTGTVGENIAFGRPDASRREIAAAARAVGALPTIAALSGGMNHPVGERGQGLSAGQRQLIALARAELVDPDLLLLDEATATLDPVTELAVLEAGRHLARSRTAVVVAHRLATAARADLIVVVDGGRIVESGTHERLREAGGHYARLWEAGRSEAYGEAQATGTDEADPRAPVR
ncbi:ABC transporter ATP-binding protein [Rhodococcus sp. D2-41]|uniref:ABC transporter ATP-binding protein/permease n=1 Tax=Speluncibacter jeojiensis TaxID=2710754 RepID=A0A9X4REK8_9ACTN|nr:ABC transporter ATP-binding protein [Rhodococcus sp. D2-41]MDG3012531.1 ABC transporter ATP-binding protein [Rhodococcus sp. D2-41]MDG3015352.1 ABC transporter ATP-binding protein/permease [Corynebacteriales bacterium D3-21]